MIGLLLFLYGVIFGYWYITDSTRVRNMAQSYLQDLTGGKVTIRSATLSVFEGLRLDDVQVYVDDTHAPDSMLFSAETFLIKYNQRAMLHGRLEATQIVAKRPHVQVTENVDNGRWNFHRIRGMASSTQPSGGGGGEAPTAPKELPEILLRDARVDYSEIRGGKFKSLGIMTIDGQLTTSTDGRIYNFQLQSRGLTEGVGPLISGSIVPATGQISASMQNFVIGRDIPMLPLPAQVRNWWQQHRLDGSVRVPDVVYVLAGPGRAPSFRVETVLENVALTVDPREWMSSTQVQQIDRLSQGLEAMQLGGLGGGGPIAAMRTMIHPTPLRLQNVSGVFMFTPGGIEINGLAVNVEENTFKVNGSISGYSPDAAAKLHIASIEGQYVRIPHLPRYVNAMPVQVREIYDLLRPEVVCSVSLEVSRGTEGAKPECSGEINVVDGKFIYKLFPYQVRGATGKIVFGRDEATGIEGVDIRMRGHGVLGGPNENSVITIDGWIGPFDESAGVNVRVEGTKITSEPELARAFPEHVQTALKMFDADGRGEYPKFRGSFTCDIICAMGIGTQYTVNTDITLDDASAKLVATPITLEHITGQLRVREGYVEIVKATMQRGDASLVVDGKVSWPTNPFTRRHSKQNPFSGPPPILIPDLTITARGMPAEEIVMSFLTPERQEFARKLGIQGKIDCDGVVKGTGKLKPTTRPGDPRMSEVNYDVSLSLREGSLLPVDGKPGVTGLAGSARLRPTGWEIHDFTARRGESEITASGTVIPGDPPRVSLAATAKDLIVDKPIYDALPEKLKTAWDSIGPSGKVDLDFAYNKGEPVTSVGPSPLQGYQVTLRPKGMSIEPRAVPYKLDNLTGSVTFSSAGVTIQDLAGDHGNAKLVLSGKGTTTGPADWDVKIRASELEINDELLASMPRNIKSMFDSIKLRGKVGLDISRLAYREQLPAPELAEPKPEIDLAATIYSYGASMDVGMPLSDVTGQIDVATVIRQGRVGEMRGRVNIATVNVADRKLKNFYADISKPPDQPNLQMAKIQANIAGGDLAGQLDLHFPEKGQSSYSLNLILRNANVKELANIGDKALNGQLSASLAIEGSWTDSANRRGRGDVTVTGKQMYQIPVLLGLLEITNLSLPVSNPFNEGTARYSIEGKRVAFEQIEMRSDSMLMKGNGYMDFGTRQVRMNFVTDNPNLPKVPFIHDLLQGARQELFQIQVRGTIQEPKVSASSMTTFTTTVDEVFRGDEKE